MLRERNNTTHIYDASAAMELVQHILDHYIPAFLSLQNEIEAKYGDVLEEM